MKRVGGLFDLIADRRTLSIAAHRAMKGKRDRVEVQRFVHHLDRNLERLVDELCAGSFEFSDYRAFHIRDPKSRLIHAPPFTDRVVHHAMIHTVGPTLEQGAIHDSYACRKGKGQHAAITRIRHWIKPDDWFLKLDIHKFYDTASHEFLRLLLRRRFRETRLLNLFDQLLASYSTEPGKGIPIGALTSQSLGNFYLDVTDRWAKQTMLMKRYARYMDDMIVLGTRAELSAVSKAIGALLESMGLNLNPSIQLNRVEVGIPFLGFVIYLNRIRLNKLGRKRLRRNQKRLELDFLRGEISEIELQQQSTSLFNHAKFANDVGWRRQVCKFTLLGES